MKQKQHTRRYKTGKVTLVNKGNIKRQLMAPKQDTVKVGLDMLEDNKPHSVVLPPKKFRPKIRGKVSFEEAKKLLVAKMNDEGFSPELQSRLLNPDEGNVEKYQEALNHGLQYDGYAANVWYFPEKAFEPFQSGKMDFTETLDKFDLFDDGETFKDADDVMDYLESKGYKHIDIRGFDVFRKPDGFIIVEPDVPTDFEVWLSCDLTIDAAFRGKKK